MNECEYINLAISHRLAQKMYNLHINKIARSLIRAWNLIWYIIVEWDKSTVQNNIIINTSVYTICKCFVLFLKLICLKSIDKNTLKTCNIP